MIALAIAVVYTIVAVWFAANIADNAEEALEVGKSDYNLTLPVMITTMILTVVLWPIALIVAGYVTLRDRD